MRIVFREWEDSAVARRTAAALDPDEIQVWIAPTLIDQAGLTALVRLLSPDERERAARFIVSEPRSQFVVGRVLLRQLLAACLNIEPVALVFSSTPRGKPCLDSPFSAGDFRFNLSHSGSLVAVALTRGREVGVDLERIDLPADWPLLAERVFSPRELGELHALPAAQRSAAFFKGWTRKEAYLKATGEGLTVAPAAVEVSLAPDQDARLLLVPDGSEAARRWTIRDLPLPPGFAGAVAFENRRTSV